MASSIKEALKDCEGIMNEIMNTIDNRLRENNINFIHENKSEIIIKNNNKKNIVNLLNNIDNCDNDKAKLLIQINESNNNVYIRQKFD